MSTAYEPLSDYRKYFLGESYEKDMQDEIRAREESREWEPLKTCPCCGADAEVHNSPGHVQIACSAKLCRLVTSDTMAGATNLWNHEGRFTD